MCILLIWCQTLSSSLRPTKGMAEFLQNLQTLVRAFDSHSRKKTLTKPHHSIDQGIKMVENVLYVHPCSQKAEVLQSLKESSTTDGPGGTVSNKCSKSLGLLKKSLRFMKAANIRDLPLFPGYKIRLNMESLLTLHIENQHA